MFQVIRFFSTILLPVALVLPNPSRANRPDGDEPVFWMKVKASTPMERSEIADIGVSVEAIEDDYIVVLGTKFELAEVKKTGRLETSFEFQMSLMDFPEKDSNFHNYNETIQALKDLAQKAPEIARYEVIGKSVEGREIANIRISTDLKDSHNKPAAVFIGTHHAREHLSTEIPILLAGHLVNEFKKGTRSIVQLLESREIHIIPMLNPDGVEYDITNGTYKAWRKNRKRNHDGTYGVDLNRNYSYNWGTGGASADPRSETYRGPEPFSEPETQAIKTFIEAHDNINVLLSFHTFSELILYPWGHKNDPVGEQKDRQVFETMAQQMSKYNGYKPQQSSKLYIASGDTVDWAYGVHKIFAFTFEMDPRWAFGTSGFYPGQDAIPRVFEKNLGACLYLISYADNPYRVLQPAKNFGLSTPLVH